MALAFRDLELLRRPVAIPIGLGVEDREMLADDLAGLVALEPLGTRIPGENVAHRVEREDGIVAHALHQQPVETFGLRRRDTMTEVAGERRGLGRAVVFVC